MCYSLDMKVINYILLVVFTIAYGFGLAIDVGMFMFGGLGGPYGYYWMLPVHLLIGTALFMGFVTTLRPGTNHSTSKSLILALALLIVLSLPFLFVTLTNR